MFLFKERVRQGQDMTALKHKITCQHTISYYRTYVVGVVSHNYYEIVFRVIDDGVGGWLPQMSHQNTEYSYRTPYQHPNPRSHDMRSGRDGYVFGYYTWAGLPYVLGSTHNFAGPFGGVLIITPYIRVLQSIYIRIMNSLWYVNGLFINHVLIGVVLWNMYL